MTKELNEFLDLKDPDNTPGTNMKKNGIGIKTAESSTLVVYNMDE